MSYHPSNHPGKLHKSSEGSRIVSSSSTASFVPGRSPLPADLEKVLTSIAGGILEGHVKLATALKRRYDNQYPLVRSLADVFTAHSYILREYATYVLHLEKALEQIDEALDTYNTSLAKRSSRNLENTDFGRLGKMLISLEELAAERGESGLVISLSKPFQRLLKYPLLFQNLLFNTDPSLKEYEATLNMVDEVEEIVRSIEDEKASSEERERTRDVLARIEGLERDKLLVAPKPNRLLVSETQLPSSDGSKFKEISVRQKKSFRRLSDILKGSGESADLWVVRFSDVSLLCERVGLTHLPLSTLKSHTSKSDSLPELSGRARMSKRGSSVRPRNLYRFLKVHEWHLQPKRSDSVHLAMDDISKIRASREAGSVEGSESPSRRQPRDAASSFGSPEEPHHVPLKGDGGGSPSKSPRTNRGRDTETIASDRMSVMSFAFKGSDQVRPNPRKTTKPIAPPSNAANRAAIPRSERRMSGQSASAANAKFAHRLRPTEEYGPGDVTIRPTSRTRRSLPPAMLINKSTGASLRTTSSALSPTDRNTPTLPIRPDQTLKPGQKSNLPQPQPVPSSPRNVKGTAPPSVVTKKRSNVSLVSNRINAFENGSNRAGGRGGIGNSASRDSGMALWTTYRDGGMVGTPSKGNAGLGIGSNNGYTARQLGLGGRI